MAGATCLTNFATACCGVHTRSSTSGSCLLIAPRIISSKSAASPAGSGTMSTVPSSAVEILRSSPTSQSVPTPRQSQRNDALAQRDRRGELLGRLVLVLAVGEQDRVPQRRRAGLEDPVREPQPLADRGPAVGPQPGHGAAWPPRGCASPATAIDPSAG